ncbi:MAG: hypothetical protein JWP04_4152 [Belnapia sp.]|nr:hypothetical protein [Belnapia sp.]
MPMRAYRASTAYASAHVNQNMWRWISGFTVATAVLVAALWMMPKSGILPHLVALAGMVLGTLIMIKSQEGYVPPVGIDDDEEAPPAA